MSQQLSEHPLFLNRARYDANVNLTKGEFDRYLNVMSKDPYGTFAMISMVASFFASLAIVGTCYMNYRAIRRTNEEYRLRKRNSHGEKATRIEKRKILEKLDGPDPGPERRTQDNRRCAEGKPFPRYEGTTTLPGAPVDE